MPKAGGSPTVLAARDFPQALAVDATTLYWAWSTLNKGEILSMPKGGGSSTTLATVDGTPRSIAVDTNNIYWATVDRGDVSEVAKSGGRVFTLASNQASPVGIATLTGNVCWTNTDAGKSAGSVVCNNLTMADHLLSPVGIVITNGAIFWAGNGGASIDSVPQGGGQVRTLASGFGGGGNVRNSTAVVTDRESIYWAGTDVAAGVGVVLRVGINGGATTTLFQGRASSVAVDDVAVYWVGTNEIWRLAK